MRKFLLPVLLPTLPWALAACSFAPAYQRPAAPVPTDWQAAPAVVGQETPSAAPRTAPEFAWRDFFTDPALQGLITQALAHNRDLRVAVARVDEARALYRVQRAERLPEVDLSGSESRTRNPTSLSFGGQPSLFTRYEASVAIPAFELDFWGRVRNLSEAALAQYLATEAGARTVQLALVSDVALNYLNLLALGERLALAERSLQSRSQALDLTRRRSTAGLISNLDLRQAEGLTASARADVAALRRLREQALNALGLLTGYTGAPGGGGAAPAGRSLGGQSFPALSAGLPSEALTRRPDVIAAEQQLLAANANIGAARAAFFPRITLTGEAGYASRELDGLFSGANRMWNFLPQITLPIFTGGTLGAGLDVVRARRSLAVAQYEQTVQVAFREVADVLAARRHLGDELAGLEAARQAQAERTRLARLQYDNGLTSFLDVLDAERELFTAEQLAVQARGALLQTSVELYRALGGGVGVDAGVADRESDRTFEAALTPAGGRVPAKP